MKFGMRVFTINCLARMGVIESIRSHSLLLSSVNESLLLISLLQDRPIFFMKFVIGDLYVMPSRICEFRESRYGEKHSLLSAYMEVCPDFAIFFPSRFEYKSIQGSFFFCKNLSRQ